VDALIVETCQDPLQMKLALVAAFDSLEKLESNIPVMLSVTIETNGTMLVGTSIDAVVTTAEPFPLFSLGINCATGPELMIGQVKYLSRTWRGRISVIPNAGMPQIKNDQTYYPLRPSEFARRLKDFVVEDGVSIVGGCCGTTPDHISALARELKGSVPARREPAWTPSLSSLYESVEARQEIPPLIIGERMNTHGSRRFKKLLLAEDYEGAARIGSEQETAGAHLLDVCTAFAGRDEREDVTRLVNILNTTVKLPLVIDSTRPDTIEAALEIIPGRCLVNSINLEDGGVTARRVLKLVKRFGSAVIALTIGPNGMAATARDKLSVARDIYSLAVDEIGLRPCDIFFDPLTFTIGSGDSKLERSAIETLEAIKLIKDSLPGVFTSLGVSNVSFGLSASSRKLLNSVFLHEAINAGLDAAIVDPGKILPLSGISAEDARICKDLLLNRRAKGGESPLSVYIAHFEENKARDDAGIDARGKFLPEEILQSRLMDGDRSDIEDLLHILMERYSPMEIINRILVPAMRKVGILFKKGEMLLPFVLSSAEVMKASVNFLQPHMEHSQEDEGTRILLATVAGDVHDIGKNLVDIILSNNGYRVFNIGTNVSPETIIEKAKDLDVNAIGLSGLLVKSALQMRSSLPLFEEAGLKVPILLGGAALTRDFVAKDCVPSFGEPVVYCADAIAGLSAMQELERGELEPTIGNTADEKGGSGRKEAVVSRNNSVPRAPFLGSRYATDIPMDDLFAHMNLKALFRGRWGYARTGRTLEEHAVLLKKKAEPTLARLIRECNEGNLAKPSVAYGYFGCRSDGDNLVVEHEGKEVVFGFPRQKYPPHLCITDYFKNIKEGGDIVGFYVASIGSVLSEGARLLFESDRYHDYLMTHGFAMELAEALAEYWNRRMRQELGLTQMRNPNGTLSPGGQGLRYGFGYSSCPDLDSQQLVFDLLDPSRIGVSLTENMEMVPEATTSAIMVHHPQARYFAV
jgi:5-methyltetrahydrofolate--homocysteine methyltransferase